MRASKISLIGLVAIIFISLVSLAPFAAGLEDEDFEIWSINPSRVEIVIGQSQTIYIVFAVTDAAADPGGHFFFYDFNAPSGITVTPAPSVYPLHVVPPGSESTTWVEVFTVSIAPDFDLTTEQRVDFYFKWDYNQIGIYKSVSLYIIPVEAERWEIAYYTPTYLSMDNNDNATLRLAIKNNCIATQNFDITAWYLHHGFSANPISGSIAVGPGDTVEWISMLTCTGFGLDPDTEYGAVAWRVTNTQTGYYRPARTTTVRYIGAAENVTDLEVWWEEDLIEIPFGEMDNAYLIIKNIGSNDLTLGTGGVELIYWVGSPLWVYDFDDPGPTSIAPSENLTLRFGFWAQGDVNVMTQWATATARVEDNYGNVREAKLKMRAVVGTFKLEIEPIWLTLKKGQTGDVFITITNNENANRNYIITAMEAAAGWEGIYWAKSDPSVENVALTPFAAKQTKIKVMATAPSSGIWSYIYYVRCEQTGAVGRVEISIEIKKPPGGEYPTTPGMEGILALFAPFTGGDMVFAGYLCAIFMLIIPFVIVGLAISRGRPGLTVSIFGFLGIIMATSLGLIQPWIFIFILFVIAIYLARGSIWGRGGA